MCVSLFVFPSVFDLLPLFLKKNIGRNAAKNGHAKVIEYLAEIRREQPPPDRTDYFRRDSGVWYDVFHNYFKEKTFMMSLCFRLGILPFLWLRKMVNLMY
jgi:hypothetical protein